MPVVATANDVSGWLASGQAGRPFDEEEAATGDLTLVRDEDVHFGRFRELLESLSSQCPKPGEHRVAATADESCPEALFVGWFRRVQQR